MRLVDANVLLYAVNEDAIHHEASRAWLDRSLAGDDIVGLSWVALLAFVRLGTKSGLFPQPLSVEDAMSQVRDWTAAPGARMVHPGARHVDLLGEVLTDARYGGNLVNDAHLAALALEHRAEIVSYDTDFARFSRVRCTTPDDLLT